MWGKQTLQVLDNFSRVPEAKLRMLEHRNHVRGGPIRGRSGVLEGHRLFQQIGEAVKGLARGLGLTCIQAPGEAEAMCAALELAGLVDGCVSKDGDTLLFGAQTVYKELHLQTRCPHQVTA